MSKLQTPFRYDFVGSFLRPEKLKEARNQFDNGSIGYDELKKVEDESITELITKVKELGYHVITDGEFRRATWHLDFMWGFDGVGHAPTKTGLPFHGEDAMVDDTYLVGKVGIKEEHPFVEHFKFVKQFEDENTVAKQTMPSPAQFLAQFTMPFNREHTLKYYATDKELAEDIVKAYVKVINDLYEAGCRNIQLDDCTWGMMADKSGHFAYGTTQEGLIEIQKAHKDINNKVIGFGGRVMGDAKPKYLNSPETKLFDKSRNLYGLNAARTARKNNLIICEGYMDVISLHQAGFTQAVASLGTALTPGHARLMKRYTDNVLITYDSDEAGVKAALRAIPILKEAGLSTRVINMRPYKDPDEFIKALGTESFQDRIDKAQNSFMYEIGIIEKNYNRSDPEGETSFEKEVASRLVVFKEKLERENYLKAVCRQYMIPEDGMRDMVIRLGSNEGIMAKHDTYTAKENTPIRKKRENGVRQAEKILLTWMIEDGDIYEKVSKFISPDDFVDPVFKDVAAKIYEQYESGQINPAAIISSYMDTSMHNEIAAMFSAELSDSLNKLEREKTLNDTVIKVKKNSLDTKLDNATDARAMQDIINQQMKLNNIHINL